MKQGLPTLKLTPDEQATSPALFPDAGFFGRALVRENYPDQHGFRQWFFEPGMLFGAKKKWWGDCGQRKTPHEGLDICFYEDRDSLIRNLGKGAVVPCPEEGIVAAVLDDFLGKSVFIRHPFTNPAGGTLYSLFGHIHPVRGISAGASCVKGEKLGTIADPCLKGSAVPAHLHISIAWVSTVDASPELSWEVLRDPARAELLDPLRVLSL